MCACKYLVEHGPLERDCGKLPIEGALPVGGDQHYRVVADVRVPDLEYSHREPWKTFNRAGMEVDVDGGA